MVGAESEQNIILISDATYDTLCHVPSFRDSSAVERSPVKRLVAGSNPAPGALKKAHYCASFFNAKGEQA